MRVITTVGKRKTAVARATISEGKGVIRINRIPLEIMQPELARQKIYEVIAAAKEWAEAKKSNALSTLDIDVKVSGGGFMGQAEAARTAIARGLVQWIGDRSLRSALLKFDRKIFVSDHRRKLPKRFGGRGARKRRQKSYR